MDYFDLYDKIILDSGYIFKDEMTRAGDPTNIFIYIDNQNFREIRMYYNTETNEVTQISHEYDDDNYFKKVEKLFNDIKITRRKQIIDQLTNEE